MVLSFPSQFSFHFLGFCLSCKFSLPCLTETVVCALMTEDPDAAEQYRWDSGEKKEVLTKLRDVLQEQDTRGSRSRTIIFVTTRLFAEKLADHLNTTCVLDYRAVGYDTG